MKPFFIFLLILSSFIGKLSLAKGLEAEIGLRSNFMNSSIGDVDGNRYWLELDLKYSNLPKKSWGYLGDLRLERNDLGLMSVSLKEAYIRYKNTLSSWYIGRKIHQWSFLDSYWGLGHANNRMNIDFYRPGQEGLTGISYVWGSKKFNITAFGSYLYIPELSPSTDIDKDNRSLGTRSPWGRSFPKTTTAINPNQSLPVFYDIEDVDYAEVVLNYSLGLMAKYRSDNWLMKAFVLRKPENTSSVGGRFQAEVLENATSVTINGDVQVFYHTVFGGDIQHALNKNFKIYGSMLHVVPDEEPQNSTDFNELEELYRYTSIQSGKKIQTYAALGGVLLKRRYKIGLHYLARVSDYDVQEDFVVAYPRWSQAISLDGEVVLGGKWRLKGNIKVDTLDQSRVYSLSAAYKYNQNLKFVLGLDGIGADEVDSFWNKFQNNDAVYGAVYYRF